MSFWRNDPVVGGAPAAAESRGARGPVRIPDPEGDARRAAEAAAREAEQRRQDEAAAIAAGRFEADMADRERRLAAGPIAEARSDEANNAAFADRARAALEEYDAYEAQLGGPRSSVGGLVAALPGGETLLRALPDSIGDSPARRAAERAARDFATNILRSDSGANAPEPEVDRLVSVYFPPAGETDPQVIESYRRARETALRGLFTKAGRLATGNPQGQSEQPAREDAAMPGPTVLPRAAGVQGSQDTGGVDDVGTGLRPVPEFNGLSREVPAMLQQGASAEQILAHMQQRYDVVGASVSADQRAFINSLVERMRADPRTPAASLANNWRMLEMLPSGDGESTLLGTIADSPVGAVGLGVADVGTAGFLDEGIDAVTGGELNAEAIIGYSRDERPIAFTVGQLLGGLAIPSGMQRVALREGTAVLRAGGTMAQARAAAAAAATRRVATEAAGFGAAYGAGSANGDLGDRAVGAGIGAVAGAAGGYVGGRIAGRVAQGQAVNRAAARSGAMTDAAEYVAAAQRQNIAPFAPDAGGPMTRRVAASLEQTMTGVNPIRGAAERTLETAQAARDRVASLVGSVVNSTEGLGTQAAEGARRELRRMRFEAGEEYNRARRLAEGITIRPSRAYDTLSAHIDELTDTGMGTTGLNVLRNMQQRMEQGPISVDTLRNMRTALRDDLIEANLRGGDISRRANEVLDQIAMDIEIALSSAGKTEARQAFSRADRAWAEQDELAENVLEPIIGRTRDGLSGEEVVTRLNRALQGNAVRAVRFLNSLPDDVRNTTRASLIARMGHASDGQQNAEGSGFSLQTFLTNWNAIEDERVRLALFGREGRAALNDLARVAQGSREANRFRNTSNTAGAVPNPPTVGDFLTLGARYWGPNVTARMLTSERFVRWLAAAPKKPNSRALRAHVERLPSLARTEVAISEPIMALRNQLLSSPMLVPAAAGNEQQPARDVPPSEGGNDNGGV